SFAAQLSLLSGGCMVMEDAFHPRRSLEVVGRGTVFMAIPTFYYAFLDRREFPGAPRQWRNVRLFTCGSAPIRPDVLPELEAILGRPVINRYGMTEEHVIARLPLGGPCPLGAPSPGGSCGRPLKGIKFKVVRDDGTPAAADEPGSVRVCGPNLFRE